MVTCSSTTGTGRNGLSSAGDAARVTRSKGTRSLTDPLFEDEVQAILQSPPKYDYAGDGGNDEVNDVSLHDMSATGAEDDWRVIGSMVTSGCEPSKNVATTNNSEGIPNQLLPAVQSTEKKENLTFDDVLQVYRAYPGYKKQGECVFLTERWSHGLKVMHVVKVPVNDHMMYILNAISTFLCLKDRRWLERCIPNGASFLWLPITRSCQNAIGELCIHLDRAMLPAQDFDYFDEVKGRKDFDAFISYLEQKSLGVQSIELTNFLEALRNMPTDVRDTTYLRYLSHHLSLMTSAKRADWEIDLGDICKEGSECYKEEVREIIAPLKLVWFYQILMVRPFKDINKAGKLSDYSDKNVLDIVLFIRDNLEHPPKSSDIGYTCNRLEMEKLLYYRYWEVLNRIMRSLVLKKSGLSEQVCLIEHSRTIRSCPFINQPP
uniref:Uncharacterized protein n=1 Tax=Leersia perrieri TaxID=77586 RepID=A0A0D9X2M9_9ORYZ